MTEKARIVLNCEEKREIKECFNKVTSEYIEIWEKEKLLLDDTDNLHYIEDILCDYNVNNYKYFRRFISYLLGTDMTPTPRELFWNLDTGKRDALWSDLKSHLTNELFIKIQKHIDAFN